MQNRTGLYPKLNIADHEMNPENNNFNNNLPEVRKERSVSPFNARFHLTSQSVQSIKMSEQEIPLIPLEPKIGLRIGLQKRSMEEKVYIQSPQSSIKDPIYSPYQKRLARFGNESRGDTKSPIVKEWTPFDSASKNSHQFIADSTGSGFESKKQSPQKATNLRAHRLNLMERISQNQHRPRSIENPLRNSYKNKISGKLSVVKTERLPNSSRREYNALVAKKQEDEFSISHFENLHSIDCREREKVNRPFKRKTPKKGILKARSKSKDHAKRYKNVLGFNFIGNKGGGLSKQKITQDIKDSENQSNNQNGRKSFKKKKVSVNERKNTVHMVERYQFKARENPFKFGFDMKEDFFALWKNDNTFEESRNKQRLPSM